MFRINAIDAREIQKQGIDQVVLLQGAMERCEQAILDLAGRRKDSVTVAVSMLDENSIKVLVGELELAGFTAVAKPHVNDTHTVSISWKSSECHKDANLDG